jgi:ethanolamine-phosphate cytidylyltransferase
MSNIYSDGIFDLFHRGHLEYFKQMKLLGTVIIGVIDNNTAKSYKRYPIYDELDRLELVKSCKFVDKVIFPAPLIITDKFMKEHNIDLVVHGFSNIEDAKKQDKFFEIPIKLNKFKEIKYYDKISTTSIIKKIINEY